MLLFLKNLRNVNRNCMVEFIVIKVWVEKWMIYVEFSDGRIFGFFGDCFCIFKEVINE